MVLLGSCAGEPSPNGTVDEAVSVVTTIYPMEYFVQRIGGSGVEVVGLVKPGVEAHSFEPTPGDLRRISGADLVVLNGLALEPWMERALASLRSQAPQAVLEASDQSFTDLGEASEVDEGKLDPHLWLDPLLAIQQAERIRDALVAIDPPRSTQYAANAESLIDDLRALDDLFETRLASCRFDHFVTTHAAYGYLADRYGLVQVPIAGLSPEAEPSARELARLTDAVREMGLRHILAEPSLSARLANTVASESNLELLPIHQMESVTELEIEANGDYLGLMRDNLASLAVALECAA